MRVADFAFELPPTLIARYPLAQRSSSRLLSLDGQTGALSHGVFTDVLDKLDAGDLVVFNNTRVIPARLFGQKTSGGKVEILVERILGAQHALAHVRTSKSLKPGSELCLGDDRTIKATVGARRERLYELYFDDERTLLTLLNEEGHVPLPPYLNRADEALDRERYQTVYSQHAGAVAAPTAGLHFDDLLLTALQKKGVEMAFVTLHVGAGTFQPVQVDHIAQHVMHAEYAEVSQEVVDAVLACKARGKRVVAVGTTSVRCLESAAMTATDRLIAPYSGDTTIFIYPGFTWRVVDALITNFHLPESTLIMLVAAFAGYKNTLHAYQQAVLAQYRFFSYGDAMFISRNLQASQEPVGY